MSVAFVSLFELVLVFVFGLGAALPNPLGIPPRAEDPALLRAAPADSVLFVQWFGRAEPAPDAKNRTERLAAEPEVLELVRRLRRAIRDSLLYEAAQHPLAREALDLADVALVSPGCLFVSGASLERGALHGGLVLRLDDHAARASGVMRKLESMLVEQLPPTQELDLPATATHDGVAFRALPLPGPVTLSWGVVDRYLVLAAGAGTAEAIVRGLRGGDGLGGHEAFAALHGAVRVARPCFRSFVDVQRLVRAAAAAGGPELGGVLEALGLGGVRALCSESGLEGEGFTSRTLLGTRGAPAGLLKLLGEQPLAAADLAVVPGDATFATVLRCDPRRVYRLLRETLAKLDARAVGELDRAVAELEEALGVRFEADLLAHLGDVLSAWSAPSQGGLLFTGATAAISLSDGAAFGRVYDKVMARLEQTSPRKERDEHGRFERGFYLERLEHRGTTIHYLNMVGDDFPVAPAWCATDTHLMFSLFPQMLKASLDRGLDAPSSLAARAPLGDAPRPVALGHLDAAAAVQTLYPLLHPLAHLAAAELQRDGFDLDIGALPSQAAVARHLGPETTALVRTEAGFLLTRHGTIPASDPVLGLCGPVAAWAGLRLRYQAAAAAAQMAVERERELRAREEALRREREAKAGR